MRVLFQTTLLLTLFSVPDARASAPIEGRYWTEDKKGIIELYRSGGAVHGRILWRSQALRDENNPDPALRDRSLIGITFLNDFSPAHGQWRGGTVYSADNGRTYRGRLWLEQGGQVLKMRGFLGVSLFGRTATFLRLSADDTVPEE